LECFKAGAIGMTVLRARTSRLESAAKANDLAQPTTSTCPNTAPDRGAQREVLAHRSQQPQRTTCGSRAKRELSRSFIPVFIGLARGSQYQLIAKAKPAIRRCSSTDVGSLACIAREAGVARGMRRPRRRDRDHVELAILGEVLTALAGSRPRGDVDSRTPEPREATAGGSFTSRRLVALRSLSRRAWRGEAPDFFTRCIARDDKGSRNAASSPSSS
jgi:hypothetical protein